MHPERKASIDREFEKIFVAFAPSTSEQCAIEWSPGVYSTGNIHETQIEGVVRRAILDGRTMAEIKLGFADTAKSFVLSNDGCTHLAAFCEKLANQDEFKKIATVVSIREHVESALKQKLWNSSSEENSFIDELIKCVDQSISSYEVWVPISDVELQDDICIGPIFLKAIREVDVERAGKIMLHAAGSTGRSLEKANQHVLKLAKSTMGRACVVVQSDSDLSRAQENAFIAAEKVAALLRCLQPINICCETRSYLAPFGQMQFEKAEIFVFVNGLLMHSVSHITSPLPFALRFSQEHLAHPWEKRQIEAIGKLLSIENPSGYQAKLAHAMFAYSNCTIARSPGEKLVLAFAALESLLLINDGESIQQNLGRRIALFLEDSLEERRGVMSMIKDAYKLRSKFMHHGERPNAEQFTVINRMLTAAYAVFMKALQLQELLKNASGLGQWLDDAMLGEASLDFGQHEPIPQPDIPEHRSRITMRVRA